jgi:hypothetical protein
MTLRGVTESGKAFRGRGGSVGPGGRATGKHVRSGRFRPGLISLGPGQEDFKNLSQSCHIASAVEDATFYVALEPRWPRVKAIHITPSHHSEGLTLKRSAIYVNFYPPTRVVARLDGDSPSMFPITVALRLKPSLQTPKRGCYVFGHYQRQPPSTRDCRQTHCGGGL